jgi:hypothetical protein
LACLILIQLNSSGQTIISGKISDTANNPIPFVIVVIKKISDSVLLKHTIANENGDFKISINANSTKEVIIEFTAVNYIKGIKKVDLSNQNISLPIILRANYSNLDSIVVKSDISIRVKGDTTFFKVDSFKTGLERNLNELLKKIPGFDVKGNGKITYNGKMISKVLLDNDDLSGKNYETLTQNFSVRSLDELQVIDNYKDVDNITSSVNNKSSEMALNLKIKKEFAGKIFGNGEAGLGLSNFYKLDFQAVSLLRKFKVVSIQSLNNIGKLSTPTSVPQSNLLEYSSNEINQIAEPALLNNSNLYSLQEINQFQDILYIQGNKSAISTFSFLSSLSNKFSIKGKIELFNDNARISSNATSEFLAPYNVFTIRNNKNEERKKLQLNNYVFLNYHTSKNQIGVLFNINTISNNSDENGHFTSKNYNSYWDSRNKRIFLKMFYAKILNSNSFLTADVQYSNQKNIGDYLVNQNFFDSIFFHNTSYTYVSQNELQKFSSITSNLIYTKKSKRNSISFKLANEYLRRHLYNTIYSGNDISMLQPLSKDSLNDYLLKQNNFLLCFNNQYRINKFFTLNTDITFLKRFSSFSNKNAFFSDNLKLLSSINLVYKLSKKSQLYINSAINNKTQAANNIGTGYEIKSISEIQNGVDTTIWRNDYYVRAGFNYIDLTQKKVLVFSSFSFSNNPMIFIPNTVLVKNITSNTYVISDKNIQNYMANFSIQKFSNNRKIKLAYTFAVNKIITYNKLNILSFNKIISNSYNNDFRLNIKINTAISVEYRINHLLSSQKTTANTISSFSPKQILNSMNLQCQISKNFALVIDGTHLTSVTQKNSTSNLFLLNSSLSYNYKQMGIGININNILNNKLITQSTYTNISYNTTETDLQRRVGLLFVKFNF